MAHAKRCEKCIGKLMGTLPLRPKYDDLSRLVDEAGPVLHDQAFSGADYDATLVNRILWTVFIPDEKMTNYQEFLWGKLNRLAVERYAADYKKLYDYMSAHNQRVTRNYLVYTRHSNEIASFGQAETEAYSTKMIERLSDFTDSPQLTKLWVAHYDDFYLPMVRVLNSELTKIVEEMSPLFQRFRHNVNEACRRTYNWLHSDAGKAQLELLRERLGTCFDLEHYCHGQLESMTSLRTYAMGN